MRAAFGLLFVLGACGGTTPPSLDVLSPREPPVVEISPPGGRFTDMVQVSLQGSEGVELWYTLDGSDPLPSAATLYERPLELRDTTLVRAMGVGRDGAWSDLTSALFEQRRQNEEILSVERALTVDVPQLVFAVQSGVQNSRRALTLSSRGTKAVTVHGFEIVSGGSGYFEAGVFEVVDPPTFLSLAPGEQRRLEILYRSTRTFRSAELGILTNGKSPADGRVTVQLTGRMFP